MKMKKEWFVKCILFLVCFSMVFGSFIVGGNYTYASSASNIADVANSQVGESSGRTYREWFYGKNNSNAWCAIFVSWCANQAGVSRSVIPYTAACSSMYTGILKNGGSVVSSPQAGDLVFYYDNVCNCYAHVGIMINDTETVQGNVGGKVKKLKTVRNYVLHSKENPHRSNYTVIYVRPNYANSDDNASCTNHVKGQYLWPEDAHPHYQYYTCANCGATFTDGSTTTMSGCTQCGSWPITQIGYINCPTGTKHLAINSDHIKGTQIGRIPHGAQVKIYPEKSVGNWYWVEYNGIQGYSYKSYISDSPTLCTNHVKGEFQRSEEAHPHYNHYTCATCGADFTDGTTSQKTDCTECFPPVQPEKPVPHEHKKGEYVANGAEHPHYNYYRCTECGLNFTDNTTSVRDNCEICNPKPPEEEPYYIAYVDCPGGTQHLAINSIPAKGNQIGRIPHRGEIRVYPNKTSGNWLYVNYQGTEGYSYNSYITTAQPPEVTQPPADNFRYGIVTGTDGKNLAINDGPMSSANGSNKVGRIPPGGQMKVYPDRTSGNWYWVEYNGIQGYAYKKYITLQ